MSVTCKIRLFCGLKSTIFNLLILEERNAGACLTLLFNAAEETLRGMNDKKWKKHSDFLILDFWIHHGPFGQFLGNFLTNLG